MSRSQFDPGKTTTPNFMELSNLDYEGTKRPRLWKIVHPQDINHNQPMKYVGTNGLDGVIICRCVKGGERHGHDDPVLIRINPVDENNDHSDDQVEEKKAPTFADL